MCYILDGVGNPVQPGGQVGMPGAARQDRGDRIPRGVVEISAGDGIRQVHGQRVDPTQCIGLFEHAGEDLGVRLRGGVGIAGGLVSVEDETVPAENRGVVADGCEGVGGVAVAGVESEAL